MGCSTMHADDANHDDWHGNVCDDELLMLIKSWLLDVSDDPAPIAPTLMLMAVVVMAMSHRSLLQRSCQFR